MQFFYYIATVAIINYQVYEMGPQRNNTEGITEYV